jgi:flagellar secretion chaperone FliS
MSFAMSQYRATEFQTASPGRVIVAFYDGALRFIRLAVQAIEARDYAVKGQHLSRAHAIVSELRATLDPSRAAELCAELDRLYVFVLDCITEANMKMQADKLHVAMRVLEKLRSAWAAVVDEPTAVRVVGSP